MHIMRKVLDDMYFSDYSRDFGEIARLRRKSLTMTDDQLDQLVKIANDVIWTSLNEESFTS